MDETFKIVEHDIETSLRRAKSQLQDAIWEENEELQKALKRQIVRLEMLAALSARASQEA